MAYLISPLILTSAYNIKIQDKIFRELNLLSKPSEIVHNDVFIIKILLLRRWSTIVGSQGVPECKRLRELWSSSST